MSLLICGHILVGWFFLSPAYFGCLSPDELREMPRLVVEGECAGGLLELGDLAVPAVHGLGGGNPVLLLLRVRNENVLADVLESGVRSRHGDMQAEERENRLLSNF